MIPLEYTQNLESNQFFLANKNSNSPEKKIYFTKEQ